MYKGKFDQKQKGGSNVRDIVSQRNQPAAPDFPELKPTSPRRPRPQQTANTAGSQAAPGPRTPAKAPVPKAAPAQKPPQKGGPRLGGVIFYTLYFLFILLFFLGTFVGLIGLKGWLVKFEASQPTAKSQEVFAQLFENPDWNALYEASGAADSPYEGQEAFVTYMEEKVGNETLTFFETTAGLSGDKKYVVRLGDEKIATFTLKDLNPSDVNDSKLKRFTTLHDWELSGVEVFFERSGSYRIEVEADHTVTVNGVALDDSAIIQKATTKAEEYLPTGVTSAKMYTMEVTGLMNVPTVVVTDKEGNEKEVTFDEATNTFTQRTEANTIGEAEEEVAIKAAQTHSLFMIEKASLNDVAKYFDTDSPPYKTLASMGDLWMQDSAGNDFTNVQTSNYERYTEDIFSVRVTMDQNTTRTNGTVKTIQFDQTLFFSKNESGSWKVFAMTNKDVSAPQGQVRLTFKDNDENVIDSNFFSTDASEIITPIVTVPEGKVFSGWVRRDVDDSGVTSLTLVFQPDPVSGKVTLGDNANPEPMTLYPLFEDPGSATTAPEATEAAETGESTEGVQ